MFPFLYARMHLFDERGNTLCFEKFTWKTEQDAQRRRYFTTCHGNKIIGTDRARAK